MEGVVEACRVWAERQISSAGSNHLRPLSLERARNVKNRHGRMLLLILSIVNLVACDREQQVSSSGSFATTFPGGSVVIEAAADTIRLGVEIAETDQQRSMGLMHRASLAADSGMIFLFPAEQPPEKPFWMYNTLIPLTIAFLDRDGRIAHIRDMEPCPSPYPQYCPNYAATVPYWSALEVNRGLFTRRGITIGDRVIIRRD
jgi:uncharacterized membrane protein (UPF0127 family)